MFEGPNKLVQSWPADIVITTLQGSKFSHCDLNQCIYRLLFFYGVYEMDVDWMCSQLLRPGDVFVDIGACFGCHTIANAFRVGAEGRVYAIEPQPDMFSRLAENIVANGLRNAEASLLALSDRDEILQLHRFPDLDVGHASISDQGRTVFETLPCTARTLDQYIETRGVRHVTLVKLDVEGAEWKVLKGAENLLSRPAPPMWIVEVNTTTAQACGYSPQDLFGLLTRYGYAVYRPVWGRIVRTIARLELCPFDEMKHGQNLLCAIPSVHRDRLAQVGVR